MQRTSMSGEPASKRARVATSGGAGQDLPGEDLPIDGLPAELLGQVFEHAGVESVWRSRRVCRRWRATVDAHRWKTIALEAEGKARLTGVTKLVQRGKLVPASGAAVELKLMPRRGEWWQINDAVDSAAPIECEMRQWAIDVIAGGVELLTSLQLAVTLARGRFSSVWASLVISDNPVVLTVNVTKEELEEDPFYQPEDEDEDEERPLTVSQTLSLSELLGPAGAYSFVVGSLAALHASRAPSPSGSPGTSSDDAFSLRLDVVSGRVVSDSNPPKFLSSDDVTALLGPLVPSSLALPSARLSLDAPAATALASSLAASLRVADLYFESPEALAALGSLASLEELTARGTSRTNAVNGLVQLAASAAGRSLKRLTFETGHRAHTWSGAAVRAVASMPLLEDIKGVVLPTYASASDDGAIRDDVAVLGGMPKLRALGVELSYARDPVDEPFLGLADAVRASRSLSELFLTIRGKGHAAALELLAASRAILRTLTMTLSADRAAAAAEVEAIVDLQRLHKARITVSLERTDELLLLRALSSLGNVLTLNVVNPMRSGGLRLLNEVVRVLLAPWLPDAALSVSAYGG